jgi:hypothetical protein
MVLYHYDFENGREGLTLRGRDQLAKIAALLPVNFSPVIIERTPDNPALAESRRRLVLNELARGPFPVPPERVVIGLPIAAGLQGTEAEIIYSNLLTQTRNAGVSTGTTTGGLTGSPTGGTAVPTTQTPPAGQ